MWKYLALSGFLLIFTFCKSSPQQTVFQPKILQQGNPSAVLEFEHIEVLSMKKAALYYRLMVSNPLSQAMDMEIKGWNVLLNEMPFNGDNVTLQMDSTTVSGAYHLHVESGSTLDNNVVLYLDLDNSSEYIVELFIDIECHYMNDEPSPETITANVTLPWIMEPEFIISSIKILQADIVNTRAEMNLIIKNPNVFPIHLLSFSYELYGDGNFWASGTEKDLQVITAKNRLETIINFEMNFIGMKRQLLDDIIAMRRVRYRVVGKTEVGTDMPWLPGFSMIFDKSGDSAVLK
jgi:LEA14-like dessication related protein